MGTGVEEVALAETGKSATEAAGATLGAGEAASGLAGFGEAASGLTGLGEAGALTAAAAPEALGIGGLVASGAEAAAPEALGAGMSALSSAGADAGAGASVIGDIGASGASSIPGAGEAAASGISMTPAQIEAAVGTPGYGTSGDIISPAAGSSGNTVSQALKALGSGALKYGPLINSTIGLARQGSGSAQKQLQAAAGPAQAVSNQLLAQFQSGQLTGADQYQIAQWSQQQKAKLDQYYSKAGLANSSMHQSALQQVDQQAEAMRQQAVQNLLNGGLKAAGVSSPLVMAGVNAGMKQDQEAQKAMSDFIAQLAKMNTPVPTGTPG